MKNINALHNTDKDKSKPTTLTPSPIEKHPFSIKQWR